MGQIISDKNSVSSSNTTTLVGATGTTTAPGFLGVFGSGAYQPFSESGNFTIPPDVTKIRVRVVGGGGAGGKSMNAGSGISASGGAGGGYAHGIFTVNPGDTYTVTVGQRGVYPEGAGGTTSFGALISATGGSGGKISAVAGGVAGASGPGGIGVGGDFQANGGVSGTAQNLNSAGTGANSGGGGAGSQFGNGGNSGIAQINNGSYKVNSGGGGLIYNSVDVISPTNSLNGASASAFSITGLDCCGGTEVNPINAIIRFPFDGFTSAGDKANTAGYGSPGNTTGPTAFTGEGGGGGGSPTSSSNPIFSYGGNGICIVEW